MPHNSMTALTMSFLGWLPSPPRFLLPAHWLFPGIYHHPPKLFHFWTLRLQFLFPEQKLMPLYFLTAFALFPYSLITLRLLLCSVSSWSLNLSWLLSFLDGGLNSYLFPTSSLVPYQLTEPIQWNHWSKLMPSGFMHSAQCRSPWVHNLSNMLGLQTEWESCHFLSFFTEEISNIDPCFNLQPLSPMFFLSAQSSPISQTK